MMTVSKEILMHPDFLGNLADELCQMLEALIDAEFEKGDETDFDFIDECADAINAIRSGDDSQVLPIISRNDFLKKVGVKAERKFKVFVAACAAVAVLFAAGTQIRTEENITLVHSLSGIVSNFIEKTFSKEETTQPESTQPESTSETPQTEKVEIIGISVETTADFKTEYTVGESFSDKGIKVFAEYSNGERKLVTAKGFTLRIPEPFASKAGYETVIISAAGFEETLEVRVIDSIKTPKLTSIYALFPEDFTFMAKDIDNVDLSEMQVFAVYSDGTEKELSKEEYEVTAQTEKTLFKQSSWVTVSYGGCSCSFMIMKE